MAEEWRCPACNRWWSWDIDLCPHCEPEFLKDEDGDIADCNGHDLFG